MEVGFGELAAVDLQPGGAAVPVTAANRWAPPGVVLQRRAGSTAARGPAPARKHPTHHTQAGTTHTQARTTHTYTHTHTVET